MEHNQTDDVISTEIDPDLRLLLIGHAEAMAAQRVGQATIDTGLTARGWQQTDALARWLKDRYAIAALHSAPKLRNRLTAQRLGQALGLPVTVQSDWPEAPATVTVTNELAKESSADSAAAPSLTDYCGAQAQRFEGLQRTANGKTIAIVMEAPLIAATIACLTDAQRLRIASEPTAVTELCLHGDQWVVQSINRHEHLPTPPGVQSVAPDQPAESAPADTFDEDLSAVIEVYNHAATQDGVQSEQRQKRVENLLRFAKLPEGTSILDVGAGSGVLTLALAETKPHEVIGVDISPVMLEQAEFRRLNSAHSVASTVYFRLAAAHALPFRDERFDVVICRLLLHHIRDAEKVLNELVRVLHTGGILLLADLLSNDDPVKRATQNTIEERRNPTHYAARSAQQYRDLLTNAGLTVVDEKTVTFERELDEWLAELPLDSANGAIVREMMEAGIETDAAGLHTRRQGETIIFEQRLYYCKAIKEKE